MFAETLERRKTYTNLQNTVEVGSDMFLHYYRLAYSYKRLGLSFYGELGNPRGRYYNVEVGRTVTLSGQHFIRETMDYAERRGFRPLYGDTDSMYIQLDPAAGEGFVAECQAMYLSWLDGWNVPRRRCTVELEYEDVYSRVVFINKKRYFGRLAWHKGQPADHLEVKGLEYMRSDGLELSRQLQGRVMRAIAFDGAGPEAVLELVEEARGRLLRREVPAAELMATAGLTRAPERYTKAVPPHVRVVQDLRAEGAEWYVGMKVPYIWVPGTYTAPFRPDPRASLGENLRAHSAWAEEEARVAARRKVPPDPVPVHADHYDPDRAPYDGAWYWSRKAYPPILRILEVAFPGTDWHALSEEGAKRDRRLVRYRRELLDPARRERALERAGADRALTPAQREDLTRFYVRQVLGAGG
jgi:DNA polymerase elongation subunit (family B)